MLHAQVRPCSIASAALLDALHDNTVCSCTLQLVMYPILDLSRHQRDLHWYLRSLEQVIIRALDSVSGLQGEVIPGLTGVWVNGTKLAAIGVRAKKWVTYHGLALNVATNLSPFQLIVPCGISDRPVGSVQTALSAAGIQPGEISQATCRDVSNHTTQQQQHHTALLMHASTSVLAEGRQQIHTVTSAHTSSQTHKLHATKSSSTSSPPSSLVMPQNLAFNGTLHAVDPLVSDYDPDPLLTEYKYALIEAFEEVFDLELVHMPSDLLQWPHGTDDQS